MSEFLATNYKFQIILPKLEFVKYSNRSLLFLKCRKPICYFKLILDFPASQMGPKISDLDLGQLHHILSSTLSLNLIKNRVVCRDSYPTGTTLEDYSRS